MNKTSSYRLESKSNNESYIERAGSFGYVALMVLFYFILFGIYWLTV